MKKYIEILKQTQLFAGIKDNELSSMLDCLQATIKTYKKGEYIFREGDYIDKITILVQGKLIIQKDDFWGNRSIVSAIRIGEMFGEAYATPDSGAILNDVIAEECSTVISFNIYKLLTVCPSSCRFHSIVIQNLFFAISEKNRKLVQKIGYMSNRSTHAKLLSYLSDCKCQY